MGLFVMEQRYQAMLAVVQEGWKVAGSPSVSASPVRASTPGSGATNGVHVSVRRVSAY